MYFLEEKYELTKSLVYFPCFVLSIISRNFGIIIKSKKMHCIKKEKKTRSLADQIIDEGKKAKRMGKREREERRRREGERRTISRTNAFHDVTRE